MEEAIKTVNKALDHSFAQAFLIFAGIFTVSIVFVDNPQNQMLLMKLALFTLFYAVIMHFITTIRKHPDWGRHAVGSGFKRGILFTVIFLLYTAAWITGLWNILLNENPSSISLILSAAAIILTAIWLVIMFCCFWKDKRDCIKESKENKDTYEFAYRCKNCEDSGSVNIKRGKPYHDQICPNCCLYELKKQNESVSETPNETRDKEEKQDYTPQRRKITFVLGMLALIVPVIVLRSPIYLQETIYLYELAIGFSAGLLGLIVRNFIFLSSGIKEKSGKDIHLAYLAYSAFVLFTSLLIFAFLKINLSVIGLEFYLLLLSLNFYAGVITYGVLNLIKEAVNQFKK